jgi:hypothetical protein
MEPNPGGRRWSNNAAPSSGSVSRRRPDCWTSTARLRRRARLDEPGGRQPPAHMRALRSRVPGGRRRPRPRPRPRPPPAGPPGGLGKAEPRSGSAGRSLEELPHRCRDVGPGRRAPLGPGGSGQPSTSAAMRSKSSAWHASSRRCREKTQATRLSSTTRRSMQAHTACASGCSRAVDAPGTADLADASGRDPADGRPRPPTEATRSLASSGITRNSLTSSRGRRHPDRAADLVTAIRSTLLIWSVSDGSAQPGRARASAPGAMRRGPLGAPQDRRIAEGIYRAVMSAATNAANPGSSAEVRLPCPTRRTSRLGPERGRAGRRAARRRPREARRTARGSAAARSGWNRRAPCARPRDISQPSASTCSIVPRRAAMSGALVRVTRHFRLTIQAGLTIRERVRGTIPLRRLGGPS